MVYVIDSMLPQIKKIHKITLPTGFPIGDVNVYIVKDDPVTLIDTGVNGAIAEHIFSKNLSQIGLSFYDIKRIIVTHTHLDHCGLAGRIQELSDAKVYVYHTKTRELENFSSNYLKQTRKIKNFYLQSAVPSSLLTRGHNKRIQASYMGSSAQEVKPLKDGDKIESSNYSFDVIHTPGHTDNLICLHESKKGILFSSDHLTLLNKPFVRFREIFEEESGELGCMKDFFNSLNKISKLEMLYTFPGHGDFILDPKGSIEQIKDFYIERKNNIAKILRRGLKNRFELCRALFGFLNDREIFKGIPEITGLLELLESEGGLKKLNENGIIYYTLDN